MTIDNIRKKINQDWILTTSLYMTFIAFGLFVITDHTLMAQESEIQEPSLIISEFMAINGSKQPLTAGELLDEDGDSSDWIEIYNPTETTIDFDGWYLTENGIKFISGDDGCFKFPGRRNFLFSP